MSKKVLCLTIIVLLLLCVKTFAGGVGNCLTPVKTTSKHSGAGVGFEYNGVSSRLMKMYSYTSGIENMKVRHLNQYYGKITMGLSDNYDIFAKIGGCSYNLKFDEKDGGGRGVIINLKNGLYVGAGFNALFPLVDLDKFPLSFGYNIQGNGFLNDVDNITRGGVSAIDAKGGFYGFDGQNSLYLSGKYDVDILKTSIIPYIGAYQSWIVVSGFNPVAYSTVPRGTLLAGAVEGTYSPAFDVLAFGLLLGVDIDIAKYVNINIAGRFIGETAITTGATVKF